MSSVAELPPHPSPSPHLPTPSPIPLQCISQDKRHDFVPHHTSSKAVSLVSVLWADPTGLFPFGDHFNYWEVLAACDKVSEGEKRTVARPRPPRSGPVRSGPAGASLSSVSLTNVLGEFHPDVDEEEDLRVRQERQTDRRTDLLETSPSAWRLLPT